MAKQQGAFLPQVKITIKSGVPTYLDILTERDAAWTAFFPRGKLCG
jgi:hypothetical protein